MNACADGLNYYLAHAPAGEAPGDHAIRALDGAHLQRGQHRRRHRAGQPGPARGVLRQGSAGAPAALGARADAAATPTSSRADRTASPSRPRTPPRSHALLLINPHTSFFFRAEVQMVSDEGLNAYGAVTWGQFFIYQGFNERAGWMHTSSGVDNIDEYLETVVKKGDGFFYRYGARRAAGDGAARSRCPTRPAPAWPAGRSRSTAPITGPIVREADGKWVSVRLMQEPLKALTQSYTPDQGEETTRRSARRWSCTPTRRTTRSTPTPTATSPTSTPTSSRGATPRFDWTQAGGRQRSARRNGRALLSIDETPSLLNPASGWLYNTNNWPWSAAGAEQPEAGGLSRPTWRAAARKPARHARAPRARGQEGLHARLADRARRTTATSRRSRT